MTQLIENLALLIGGLAAGLALGRAGRSAMRPGSDRGQR